MVFEETEEGGAGLGACDATCPTLETLSVWRSSGV